MKMEHKGKPTITNEQMGYILTEKLTDYMQKNSGIDLHRDYVGISHVWECPRLIFDNYYHGRANPSTIQHIKTFQSYFIERSIMGWLADIFDHKITYPGPEIHQGLIQGHTDGMFRNDLIEIKTVPLSQHMPRGMKIPNRAFHQIQTYMHYLKIKYCQVIYYARATGEFKIIRMPYKAGVGHKMEAKLNWIVNCINNDKRPDCVCGRCKE
jgi:hypothetical protein